MDFLGNTTHHDYKALSPPWPTGLNAVNATYAAHLRDKISNAVLAIEVQQERLRSLFPQYSKAKWDGATSNEISDKEAELKETSGKLKSSVEQFEALLSEWEEKVGNVEEKGGKRKRNPPEEIDEGDCSESEDGFRPPPATKARTSRFDEPSSTIPRPIVQKRYRDVRAIPSNDINVGDIGWAPLPRMSLMESARNVLSEYGGICIKVYPFIIVKKLDDCMLGLVISTAGGRGLANKAESLRQRSTQVVKADSRGFNNTQCGWFLNPRCRNLEVASGGYEPGAGAFVDMLDSHKIYYNSRFEKRGCLTPQSRIDLGRMRMSALVWEASEG